MKQDLSCKNLWVPAGFLAVLLLAWELIVRLTAVRPQVLPAPTLVASSGWEHRSTIGEHALATLNVTLLGFAVSLACAWLIAIVIDFSPLMRRGLVPLLISSQTIPIVAIAPLMIIWFGFGLLPKILVVALVTFFPVTIGLVDGFARADREASALLRSMGAGRIKEFLFFAATVGAAAVFHFLAHRHYVCRGGRHLRRVCRREAGLGHLYERAKECFSHRFGARRSYRRSCDQHCALPIHVPGGTGRYSVAHQRKDRCQ